MHMHEDMSQYRTNGFLARVLCVVVLAFLAIPLGYGIGLGLHRFGFGGCGVWLLASSVFPMLIGLLTPTRLFKRWVSVALTALLIAFAFNAAINAGASRHAYKFAVEHGTPHDAALKQAINYPTLVISSLFSVSAPLLILAKSASATNDKEAYRLSR